MPQGQRHSARDLASGAAVVGGCERVYAFERGVERPCSRVPRERGGVLTPVTRIDPRELREIQRDAEQVCGRAGIDQAGRVLKRCRNLDLVRGIADSRIGQQLLLVFREEPFAKIVAVARRPLRSLRLLSARSLHGRHNQCRDQREGHCGGALH